MDVSQCLGIQKMPPGYALMIDPDGMFYYWINAEGQQSAIHWNKWSVYKMAKSMHEKKTCIESTAETTT